MTFELSHRSLVDLQGVHHDLVRVVMRALQITPYDFAIIQGLRTEEEEQACVAKGLSQTMHSRHLVGMAVDFMAFIDGVGTFKHPEVYAAIAGAFKKASVELSVPTVWGGSWATLKDLDHIELDRHAYPDPVTR